ncbi:MAG: phage tail protein, partial [Janthinobacterium lividum]
LHIGQVVESFSTTTEVDRVRLDFTFPNGLYRIDKNGNKQNQSIQLYVNYRQSGTSGAWTSLQAGNQWYEIDGAVANTVIAVSGLRMTVQVFGSAGQATTPYSVQANIIPPTTSPVTSDGTPVNGWAAGSSNYYDVNGKPSASVLPAAGTIFGKQTGVIKNTPVMDAAGNISSYTAASKTIIFEISALYAADYSFTLTGGNILKVEGYYANNLLLTNAYAGQWRVSFTTPSLTRAAYDFQISRKDGESDDAHFVNAVYLTDTAEITDTNVGYINTAHYGVSAVLGTDLTSEPACTALVKGKMVNIYDRTGNVNSFAWSDNPADIALDVLLWTRNNYAISSTRIDFEGFDDWRTFCNENGLTFNGVFETVSNIWDVLQIIARIGRGMIVQSGLRWSVVMEAPADPVMMFTQDNIIKGSFTNTWSGRKDRSNFIEVQYWDQTDKYRQHSAFAVDYNYQKFGDAQVQSTIQLVGCVDFQRAQEEANFQLYMNKYVVQSTQFDVMVEALAVTVGDVVQVQHNMPTWGYSGIVTSTVLASPGRVSQITIDSPLPTTATGQANWHLLLLQSVILNGTAQVQTISGNFLQLQNISAAVVPAAYAAAETQGDLTFQLYNSGASQFADILATADRITLNGADYNVMDKTNVAGAMVLTLDRTPVGKAGDTLQIYKTDQLLDADITVAAPVNGQQTLTITSWNTTAGNASVGSRVMLGQTGTYGKPFRVTKIGYKDDHTRSLTMSEYNASIYTDDATYVPNYSNLSATPYQVEQLAGESSSIILQGGALQYYGAFSWTLPLDDPRGYLGATIWGQANGGTLAVIGNVVSPGQTFAFPGKIGDVVTVKVVAYDKDGEKADFNQAPLCAVTISNDTGKPGPVDVTSFQATGGFKLIAISWVMPADSSIDHIELWENNSASLAGAYRIYTGLNSSYIRQNLEPSTTWYYWIRSVSASQTNGDFLGPINATTSYIVSTDLAADIANTAKYAQGLLNSIGQPTDVTSLPDPTGYATGSVVYNEGDGKLYKKLVDGGPWVDLIPVVGEDNGQLAPGQMGEIAASQIQGTLTAAQIASLTAAQLTGQITSTQITDGAISTPKLAAGSVTTAALAASSVTAETLAVGFSANLIWNCCLDVEGSGTDGWAWGAGNSSSSVNLLAEPDGTHRMLGYGTGTLVGTQLAAGDEMNATWSPSSDLPGVTVTVGQNYGAAALIACAGLQSYVYIIWMTADSKEISRVYSAVNNNGLVSNYGTNDAN